jgi:hypothetical protein
MTAPLHRLSLSRPLTPGAAHLSGAKVPDWDAVAWRAVEDDVRRLLEHLGVGVPDTLVTA